MLLDEGCTMSVTNERQLATNLKEVMERKRRVIGAQELQRANSVYLYANNPEARAGFSRVFLSTLTDHLKSPVNEDRLRTPVYLVTFALRRFCCPIQEAAGFDLKPLQAWVRQAMEGMSYLGFVEAAFYSNLTLGPEAKKARVKPKIETKHRNKPTTKKRHGTISWHVHLIVWGTSRATLKATVDDISAKHPSLITGLPAADYRRIRPEHFAGKVLYILKVPREYRVWPKKQEVIDPETGEITTHATGRFTQKSRIMRSGDQVRMFEVMRDRYLDLMMLGGGAGKDLLLAIREEALKPLRARERRQQSQSKVPRRSSIRFKAAR
jgi:hypothetical protein